MDTPPLRPASALHLSWHTYGTWLPGDERGWHRRHVAGTQPPDAVLRARSRERMTHAPIALTALQRDRVERSLRETCERRAWPLHAVIVLEAHVHAVLTADVTPKAALQHLKCWSTRALREDGLLACGRPLWQRGGLLRWLPAAEDGDRAVGYVYDDHHTRWR